MEEADLSTVPKVKMDRFCKWAIKEALKFYSDPENMKKYEAWKKERREDEGGVNTSSVTA